jgi:hypothetical protein
MNRRVALLVIDLQTAVFEDPAVPPVFDAATLLVNARALVDAARSGGVPVVYVQHCGRAGDEFEEGRPGWISTSPSRRAPASQSFGNTCPTPSRAHRFKKCSNPSRSACWSLRALESRFMCTGKTLRPTRRSALLAAAQLRAAADRGLALLALRPLTAVVRRIKHERLSEVDFLLR